MKGDRRILDEAGYAEGSAAYGELLVEPEWEQSEVAWEDELEEVFGRDSMEYDLEAAFAELDSEGDGLVDRERPRRRRPRFKPQQRGGRPRWSRPGRRTLSTRPGRRSVRGPATRGRACVCPAHRTEFVRWVQSTLNELLGERLRVTGVMTPATRVALRRFQGQHGLSATGIAGPDTERALLDAKAGPPAGPDARAGSDSEGLAPDLELEIPSRPTLRRGTRGSHVTFLQRSLHRAGFSPGAVDGIFGARTDAAVRAFQRARGLAVDGIVGTRTWGALTRRTPAPTPGAGSWVLPPAVRAAGDRQTVPYDSPPAWANGAHCSGFTDGAAELRRHILASFSGVRSIGGSACRPNTANPSETSVHGVGRALDIMIPTIGGRAASGVGDPIANWLVQNAAALGVQYVIWNRTRWSGSRTPRVAPYGGPSPHADHIHVELNLAGSRRETPWFMRRR